MKSTIPIKAVCDYRQIEVRAGRGRLCGFEPGFEWEGTAWQGRSACEGLELVLWCLSMKIRDAVGREEEGRSRLFFLEETSTSQVYSGKELKSFSPGRMGFISLSQSSMCGSQLRFLAPSSPDMDVLLHLAVSRAFARSAAGIEGDVSLQEGCEPQVGAAPLTGCVFVVGATADHHLPERRVRAGGQLAENEVEGDQPHGKRGHGALRVLPDPPSQQRGHRDGQQVTCCRG